MTPPEPPRDEDSDLALVRGALEGAPAALEGLARRLQFVPRVLAGLNARRGRPLAAHDLEDLAQDVICRIWKKLATFGGQATLESWFFGFCYLEWMNRLRMAGSLPATGLASETLPGRGDGAEAERAARAEDAARLLERLRPPERALVLMKHVEGLTFEQIHARTGTPTNTLKAQYYRALERLKVQAGVRPGGEA